MLFEHICHGVCVILHCRQVQRAEWIRVTWLRMRNDGTYRRIQQLRRCGCCLCMPRLSDCYPHAPGHINFNFNFNRPLARERLSCCCA